MEEIVPTDEPSRHDTVLEGEVLPPMTRVYNLATNQVAAFPLPPAQAVVAAYEQFTKRNFNTWQYAPASTHPEFTRGKVSVACGDWAASTKVN
jgi:hypothetical protein